MPTRYKFKQTVTFLLCSACFAGVLRNATAADPYIAEFMANNTIGLVDEFGTKSDWIEIHNPGASPVNLLNCFLTDDKTDPHKWGFPVYSLGANARLVVFASNRDLTNPVAPNNLHTNFKLSDSGEYLALTRLEINGTYTILSEFDPFPLQFRDVAYGVPSSGGAAFYLNSATPGSSNSSARTTLGPLIYNATDTVVRPLGTAASPPMTITAEVKASLHPVAFVRVAWCIMYGSETLQIMYDDGTNGDVKAGDGIYTAVVPTSGVAYGQMIRWRIIATDNTGVAYTAPPYPVTNDSDQYFGTVAQDPSIESALTVVHTFLQTPSGADNSTGTRGSFFVDGEFYDNVYVSIHGQSTSGFTKKSHGWNFNAEHSCKFWADAGKRVKGVNLLSNYADKSKVRNAISYEQIIASGCVSNLCKPVRVQLNAAFYSISDALEQADEVWLDRIGRDPDGALYKCYNTLDSSTNGVNSGVEKKTRKTESNADLQTLIDNLNESTLPIAMRRKYGYDNLDIPQIISYFVGLALISSNDHGHKNYYVYRDSNNTGEWALFPQDEDLTWGHNFNGSGTGTGYFDDGIFPTNSLKFAIGNNRLYNLFFNSPEFQKMYMRRLRTTMDEILQPGSGASGILETRIRAYLDLMDPPAIGTSDADRDYNAWAHWGNGNDMRTEAQRLIDTYLPQRRSFLFTQNPTLNGEPIPTSQPAHPVITFDTYDSNPSSQTQEQEYITLKNTNSFAVDISGWTLDGGIRYTFKPGTVIPPGGGTTENIGLLYIARNPKLFRTRSIAPTAAQFCFVTGPYDGQLSGRGEVVSLFDKTATLIATKTITPNPSQGQLYLRITELNYAPQAPTSAEISAIPVVAASDFEYIEVANMGATTIDLSGAVIQNGVDFTFPSPYLLSPNARTLVVGNIAAFRLRYGNAPSVAGQFYGNLDNTGETIELYDHVGEKVLDFKYDGTWYPPTNLGGYTLCARSPSTTPYDGYSVPTAWAISGPKGGTPGVADSYFSTIYVGWLHDNFTPAEELVVALAAGTSDPDNDGKTNSEEYQTGGNPRLTDTSQVVDWQSVNVGGVDYGAIGFNRRRFALDLTIVVEAATDPNLSAWTPVSTLVGSPVANPVATGTEHLQVRDDLALSTARRAMRLRDPISGKIWMPQVPQSVAFAALPDIPYQAAQLTLSASANSGLPVQFAVVSGPATLAGNKLTLTGAGTVVISADQPGNAGFQAATQVTQSFVVSKLDQTIDFLAIGDMAFTPQPIPLSASASSGLPITFSIVSGAATIQNGALTLSDAGSVTVHAAQDGNGIYSAAPGVDVTFAVSMAPQTIDFPAIPDQNVNATTLTLSATATSGLPVAFTLVSGPATLQNATLTFTGLGTVTVRASQDGNNTYTPAASVERSFNVGIASQTITFAPLADRPFSSDPIALVASTNSGLPITFTLVSGLATLQDNILTLTGTGAVTIRASQDGDVNFNPAVAIERTFTVTKLSQSIDFPAIADMPFSAQTSALVGSSSSGLPLAFVVVAGPASIQNGLLTLTDTGSVTLRATQNGNGIYDPAGSVDRTFNVTQLAQMINFQAPPSTPFSNDPLALTATSTSGLAVSYALVSGPATLQNGKLSFTGLGAVTVRASQGGNSIYTPAANVDSTFNVVKGAQTINFAALADRAFNTQPITLNATASSGLVVVFTLVSGPGTIQNGVLTLNAPGTITVSATQGGSSTFLPAPAVNQTFTAAKLTQSIDFATLADRPFSTEPITLSATASSGLPVVFTLVAGPASVQDGVLTLGNPGSVTVSATQDGSESYAPAAAVEQTFTVSKLSQTINFPAIAAKKFLDPPVSVSASSSAGLHVDLALISGPGRLDGDQLTILGVGTIVVEAAQSGDARYTAASARQSVVVGKAMPAIVWAQPADVAAGTVLGATQLNAKSTVAGKFVYSPAAGAVLLRNDKFTLSVEFTPADADNYEKVTASTTIRVLNTAPAVDSAPTAVPSSVLAGTAVAFTAHGSDSDGDTLTYDWDFGDGSVATGASVSHTYAAPGVYTAKVKVSDGHGGTSTSSVTVKVNHDLAISKASVKLNFQKTNSDSISVSGVLPLPAGTTLGGKTLKIDVGGSVQTIVLDAKGKGKNTAVSVTIAPPKKGVSKFTVTWSKTSFPLESMGFVNSDIKASKVTLPWTLELDGQAYQSNIEMVYAASKLKKGSAKFTPPK